MVEVALATGMRMSEILGLVWGNLDLSDRPTVAVNAQLARDHKRGRVELKAGQRSRRIVITNDLRTKLIAVKLLAGRSGAEDYGFASRTVGRLFRAAVERAGLDDAIVFHWLRHTHASALHAHAIVGERGENEQRERLAAMASRGSAMAAPSGTKRNRRAVSGDAGTA